MAYKIAYHNAVANLLTGVGVQATVTVYDANTEDLSTLYQNTGGATASNPISTDPYGRFVFYADPGLYDLEISGEGITTYTLEDVSIMPVSSPPDGTYRVTNLFVRPQGTKLEVEYET